MSKDFIELLRKYKNARKRRCKRKLGRKIKKLRIRLRNQFYAKRTAMMNTAEDNRLLEEEYRVANSEKMVKKSTKVNCQPSKLVDKFSVHFSAKPEPPAESLHLLKNLLPKVKNHAILTEAPDLHEVQDNLNRLKNGRCVGVEGFSAEQIKYVNCNKMDEYIHAILFRV